LKLETVILPPFLRTSALTIQRPRPFPPFCSFVVTNGSKRRFRISSGMPGPVSAIVIVAIGTSLARNPRLARMINFPFSF